MKRGRVFQRKEDGPWYVDYYAGGKRVRQFVGTKADATKLLARRVAEEELRRLGGQGRATNRVELTALRDAYLEDVHLRCRPNTTQSYEDNLRYILDDLPVRSVVQLTPATINAWMSAHLNHAPRTINMRVDALKRMLRWGVSTKLIESNPLLSLKPLRKRAVHHRRSLTEDEARRLIEKSPPHYSRIWMAMLGLALRRDEVQTLKWQNIDIEGGTVTFHADKQKNWTTTVVPIASALLAMFRDLRKQTPSDQEHVFVNMAGRPWTVNLRRKLRSCCKLAGISLEGVDLHALRVTFATHLIRAGVDFKTVQRLGRWKTLSVLLDLYAKSFPADQRAAVERLPYFGHPIGTQAEGDKGKAQAG